MKKKIAIVTVVYENYSVITDFLSSLEKQNNNNFHLFLADLSQRRKTIQTTIPTTILYSSNRGYAHGVNVGLKKALDEKFEYFCVVNNDTYFDKDFINCVFQSITNHPSSIIGGKIYYAPGFEYHKNKYQRKDRGNVLWYAGGYTDWNHVLTVHRGVDEVDKKQYNSSKKTDFVTGCLMCFDKSVVNVVGLWNESYFLYYEDADFCERAKRKQIALWYDPSLIMWHKNAQSTGGSGSRLHQKYQNISRLRFGLTYAPLKTRLHLIKNYLSSLLFFRT